MLKKIYCPERVLFETQCDDASFSITAKDQEDIDLIQDYSEPYNLFDVNVAFVRKINANELARFVDDPRRFKLLTERLYELDRLIIIDTWSGCNNPIINNYSNTKLRAYVNILKQGGVGDVVVTTAE